MKDREIKLKVTADGRILCPICKARLNEDAIRWIHNNCGCSFLEMVRKLIMEQEKEGKKNE